MNFVESERINRLHSRMLTDKVCCYFKLNPYVVALAQAKSPIKGSPKLFSQIVMSMFTPFLLRSFTTHSSNSVCNENMQFDYGLLLSYLRIEVMFKKMLINKILATFQTIKTKYYPFPPHFSEWHNSPLIWSQNGPDRNSFRFCRSHTAHMSSAAYSCPSFSPLLKMQKTFLTHGLYKNRYWTRFGRCAIVC